MSVGVTPLAGIRARLEAATPEWERPLPRVIRVVRDGRVVCDIAQPDRVEDAEFLAHAPEDVGLLLAVAEAAADLKCCAQVESEDDLSAVESWERLDAALARLAGGTNHEGDAA